MSPAASTPSTESLFRLGLNDALPISDEATTSRVVVNNEILRTVIFTFDTGQLLTEHTSPRAVIVTLLEGEMDFSIGERTERMGAGDVIYLAPGADGRVTVPHAAGDGRRRQGGHDHHEVTKNRRCRPTASPPAGRPRSSTWSGGAQGETLRAPTPVSSAKSRTH